MKILVTGGAGFIGSHIVDLALTGGHEVAVLDDLSSGSRSNVPQGVPLYCVDVRHAEATLEVLRTFRPDAVSHQAAQASVAVSMKHPALDASINVVGGLNVLSACRAVGTRTLVFASTGGAIYGHVPQGAANEDTPPAPVSPYAVHKLAFERLLEIFEREYGICPRILRYANVYGPRQNPHGEAGVVAIFLDRVRRGRALTINALNRLGDDGCVRDYVYVSDVARANLRALEGHLDARVLNVGTGVATPTRALALEILGRLPSTSTTLKNAPHRPGDVGRSVLDGSRIQSLLGEWTPLQQGLDLTLKSLQSR